MSKKNKTIIKCTRKISTREFQNHGGEVTLTFGDLHPIAMEVLADNEKLNRCRVSISVGTRRKLFKIDRVESVTERFEISPGLYDTYHQDYIYIKPKQRHLYPF